MHYARRVGRILEAFPSAHRILKQLYRRINYALRSERGFQFQLHPSVKIITPEEWAGLPVDNWCNGAFREACFFGYYDKTPWSHDSSKVILHKPISAQLVEICVLDRARAVVSTVGVSPAWNYQQGSQAQWAPSSSEVVMFNNVKSGQLGFSMVNINTHKHQFVPWPIQAVHPLDYQVLSINYKRLKRLGTDYGYSVKVDNFSGLEDWKNDGIWLVDVNRNTADLIVTLDQLVSNRHRADMRGCEHKINHIIYSPRGSRFAFLHRWKGNRGKYSRLYVGELTRYNLQILMDNRLVSHFNWLDEDYLIVWGRDNLERQAYFIVNVVTGSQIQLPNQRLNSQGDGHPSFSPDGQWILTDTYPDRSSQRHLFLYNIRKNSLIHLGRFHSPLSFDSELRCDLHPRWSPDGTFVSIDSTHSGVRKSYIIDLKSLI